MIELKPCPYCGGNDVSRQSGVRIPRAKIYYVECMDCNAVGPETTQNHEVAATRWNDRPAINLGQIDLKDVHARLQGEVFGGKLDFGHVGLGEFIQWCIAANGSETGCETKLMQFDLESAKSYFEDWVKNEF